MQKPPFHFSITEALRRAWQLFAKNLWLYIGLTLIMVLLNLPGIDTGNHHVIVDLFVSLVSIAFSFVLLSVFLAAVDEKYDELHFNMLYAHLPTLYQFLMFLEVGIVVALCVAAGALLLIIPGIYVLVRLALVQFAYVDKKDRVLPTVAYTWRLVSGRVFWKVLLTCIVAIVLLVCGAAFFAVGLLVTYPLAMLLLAQLYRALTIRYEEIKEATI